MTLIRPIASDRLPTTIRCHTQTTQWHPEQNNRLGKFFRNKPQYRFSDPETTACMTCRHVLEGNVDIVHVFHDADDGMWQFLCEAEHHDSEDAKMVSLSQIVALDPSGNALHDMSVGFGASRPEPKAAWEPFKT